MTLHVESLAGVVRFFSPGLGYGDPFGAVATLTFCGDLAFLCAMHGSISRSFLRELRDEFMARGILDVLTIRHGKRIWIDVATGRILSRGARFPHIK